MGSKQNPGDFDCYANAEPDEPMFVLLGRDKHAPMLVELWAAMRALDGEKPAKVAEARECAEDMRAFHQRRNENRELARTAINSTSLREAFVRYCRAMQPQMATGKVIKQQDDRRRQAERDIVQIVLAALGPPLPHELEGA